MHNYRYNTFLILRTVIFNMKCRKDGSLWELIKGITGFTAWPFFVDAKDRRWSKGKIEKMLSAKGVKIGGFGYHNGRYMFKVRKGQAHFAERIMVKAGLANLLGGNGHLAMIMGPDEEMTMPVMEPVRLTVCETCAIEKRLPVAVLGECGPEESEE